MSPALYALAKFGEWEWTTSRLERWGLHRAATSRDVSVFRTVTG